MIISDVLEVPLEHSLSFAFNKKKLIVTIHTEQFFYALMD